ncbi:MAG: metallophosphoesterase [Roseiarcus sp.]|jgi:serine/threonine protein phosphatase 1
MTAATPVAGRTDQAQPARWRRDAPRAWLGAARRRLALDAPNACRRRNVEPPGSYPPAPEGQTLYVIGDVHGRADCLARAQTRIDRDRRAAPGAPTATEIYLGDYVDRGPNSKAVLDLMTARIRATRVVALRGNHETAMESFLAGRLPFAAWRMVGGVETLLSYGFAASDLRRAEGPRCEDFAARLPEEHRRFLASLGAFHRAGGYGFVHAGLRPGVALENQEIDDLTGVRAEFLGHEGDFGFVVVHGHTPVECVDFRWNRINLDTAAYVSNRLSVLRIDAAGATLLAPEAS